MPPGIGEAAEGIGRALHACLVAVIDAGHAGQGGVKLPHFGQAADGQRALCIAQAAAAALQRIYLLPGFAGQHVQQARTVMTAHQVHQRIEEGQGIVFVQAFYPAAEGIGVQRAGDKADGGFAQGIIHHAVQRVAQAVAALRAVGYLVARILPYLAQQGGLIILHPDGRAQIAQKAHGQFVRHIQAPARCASAHPAARHALLGQDKLAIILVFLVYLGQGIHAPPAFVLIRKMLKGEPAAIG